MEDGEIYAHFDDLLCRGTGLEELLRSTADLVGRAVGWSSSPGQGLAFAAGGRPAPVDPTARCTSREVPGRGRGTVWLDASGLAAHEATLVLARLAVAVAVTARWQGHGQNLLPVLDVLLDPAVAQVARNAALARVGIVSATLVRVVVCEGPHEGLEAFTHWLSSSHRVLARTVVRERVVLLLLAHERSMAAPGVPPGVRAAYSAPFPAELTRQAYLNARSAFRFARPSRQGSGPYPHITGVWLDGDELRTIGLLSRVDSSEIEQLPDVRAVERLREAHGDLVLRVLEAYTASASMRTAAEMVHLHHNSVGYWVHKAEEELGYALSEPYARAQLFITLCLHQLWSTPFEDDV